MFDTIIPDSSIEWWAILICLFAALAMGIIFALLYVKLKSNDGYFKDMPISFALFPFIIAGMTLAITFITALYTADADNVTSRYIRAGATLVGCFLILRFRSFPRNFEDLTYLFALVGCGLLCGMGYLTFAAIIFLVLIAVFFIFHLTGFPRVSPLKLNMKVTIPEDLNYEDVFEEVMNKYTTYHHLTKIKSSDMGTLFILNFEINLKKDTSIKEFIDQVRQRNGNLDVAVTKKKFMIDE